MGVEWTSRALPWLCTRQSLITEEAEAGHLFVPDQAGSMPGTAAYAPGIPVCQGQLYQACS